MDAHRATCTCAHARRARWERARYEQVSGGLQPLLQQLGYKSPPFIPLSALAGENLSPGTAPAAASAWYSGASLLEAIEEHAPAERPARVGTRLVVVDVFRAVSASSSQPLLPCAWMVSPSVPDGFRFGAWFPVCA